MLNIKELSVIILGYNCLDYIKDCLASIYEFNDIGDALEVVLVDNSENMDTIVWVKKNYPDIIAIKNDNLGFGEGNNVGARASTGKYLLFLNPDTKLIEPVFQFAIEKFTQYNDLGCFGVQMVGADLKKNFSFSKIFRYGFKDAMIRRITNKLGIFSSKNMYTIGADMFIPRRVFFDCGMFDENIFMYYEEDDIATRIKAIGKDIAFFKTKTIIHYGGGSGIGGMSKGYIREMQSFEYAYKKHGYDFNKVIKAESRYCRFKRLFAKIFFDENRISEYKKMVEYWEQRKEESNQ